MNEATLYQYSAQSKGEWLIGLSGARIKVTRFAAEDHDYVTPEYVYADSIISYSEFQRLLSTAGII